jgi:hypothetical protein
VSGGTIAKGGLDAPRIGDVVMLGISDKLRSIGRPPPTHPRVHKHMGPCCPSSVSMR